MNGRPPSRSVFAKRRKPRVFNPETVTGIRSGSATVGIVSTEVSAARAAVRRSGDVMCTSRANVGREAALVVPSAPVPDG
jgi:hypothetical protein